MAERRPSAADARRLVLASTSPRRLALLRQVGFEPEVAAVEVDETPRPGERPEALARRLAVAKARAAPAPDAAAVVLAADTVVDLDGRVLGKPRDRAHAVAMLLALGGREHRVATGVCLRRARGVRSIVVVTRVAFGRIDAGLAARYVDEGESDGKAGGYAIQGRGARFVASLAGSYSNVVGLPLHETVRLLEAAGVRPAPLESPVPLGPSGPRR